MAVPYEDNPRYFNVAIAGPVDSPYQGGSFRLELFLPGEYPMGKTDWMIALDCMERWWWWWWWYWWYDCDDDDFSVLDDVTGLINDVNSSRWYNICSSSFVTM